MSLRTLGAAATLAFVASCSSGASKGDADAQFPEVELTSVTSSTHGLRVAVRTAPQPPQRGTCTVELRVAGADGAPVDGLDVTVVPWMPAMAHGTSVQPTVAAKGGGRYIASDVNLFMPGTWELRTSFHGPLDDDAAPSFTVP